MQPRIEKSIARFLASVFAPEGGALVDIFRSSRNGWIKLPEEFEQARKNTGLGDTYVVVYESEPLILHCLIRAIFSEKYNEELKMFNDIYDAASEKEKIECLKEISDELLSDDTYIKLIELIPRTQETREAAQRAFDVLPEDEQIEILKHTKLFLIFFFASFYNYISVMVHGQKLTKLVPLALQGNREAFCKAVQIDKNLLTGHPYFRETYGKLPMGNDEDRSFFRAITSWQAHSQTNSKIKYPSLYLMFAVLDSFGWLDKFTAYEILDMCDEAKLDRYQNRIEDENCVIKRRLEYRKMQKIGF